MTEQQIGDGARANLSHPRRHFFKGSLVASFVALITKVTKANTPTISGPGLTSAGQSGDPQGLLDAFAVSQVLLRERVARETHDYDIEAACFYPDAVVEVSWFKGTAAEFVDSGRASGAVENGTGSVHFDSMGPASISVHKDRAIADSACAIHTFLLLDGIEASMTSYTRLLCRVQKSNGVWRIARLSAIYIRDQLVPCNPAQIPKIDLNRLRQYRPSYRHLSYVLQASGRPMRNDLPGVDRPESVVALRAANDQWLHSRP